MTSRRVILDGEIVCLDPEGRPQFYDLLRHRGEQYFYAFDVMELDGRCLQSLPLMQRKAVLRDLIGPDCHRLYVEHVEGGGVELYRLACHNDLEVIVAKWRYGRTSTARNNRRTEGSRYIPPIP